jgi:SMI1-KNR4 cell-wall
MLLKSNAALMNTMQINNKQFKNFIKQPSEGFDEHSQGRSVAQLDAFEMKIGFVLPENYRKIMQQQNGGSVRYSQINGVDKFGFDCGFTELRLDLPNYIHQFGDYILSTYSEEDLQEAKQTLKPFYPERLIIISGLDGHGTVCFDYGYRTEIILEIPAVVIIDDDAFMTDETAKKSFLHFTEIVRFDNFDHFLQNLKVDTENQLEVFIGIVSKFNYEDTINKIAEYFNIALQSYKNDDRYGYYNFETWHSGHLPLYLDDETLKLHAENNNSEYAEILAWSEDEGRIRSIYTIFSPNQHRSGTYLYQDNPEVNVVIEMHKTWFAMQKPIEGLMAQLQQIAEISDVVMLD